MYKKIIIAGLLSILFFASGKSALAATPTISVSSTGSSDSVQVNITGDVNAGIGLYYNSSGSGLQVRALGNTNSNGTFSTTISSSNYNISSGSSVYVVVNGQQSPMVSWPAYSSSSSNGTISLSQTGLVLTSGQSSSVTVYNSGSGGSFYLSNNSNPTVANVNLNGSTVNVTANTQGSTVATICSLTNTTNCASIYVTVQSSGGSRSLTLSQNNVTVATGQSVSVSVSGGSGIYVVLNNSNPATIQTTINGSVVNLTTQSTSGSASITICTSDNTACSIINATVGTSNSTSVTFGQNNPTISVGQNTSVTLSGASSYNISANSNTAYVQANVSGSTLNLFGNAPGVSVITVCGNSGGCGTIIVTVLNGGSGGTLALSQSTMSVLSGQTLSVTISGGSMPYTLLPAATGSVSIYSASLNNNVINISGISSGTGSIGVCSASGGCTYIAVTVNNTGSGTSGISLGQTSLSLNVGQSSTVYITGISGYYISNNTNQNVATASINGSSVVVVASGTGTDAITICQTGGQCAVLSVNVGTTNTNTNTNTSTGTGPMVGAVISVGQTLSFSLFGSSAGYYVSPSTSAIVQSNIVGNVISLTGKSNGSASLNVCITSGGCTPLYVVVSGSSNTNTSSNDDVSYRFTLPLKFGSTGGEVRALQQRLIKEGVYSGDITGYYGNLTVAAVKAFQKKFDLDQLGNVGPGTRAQLNK